MTRDAILRLLQELDQWMELEDCPPVAWVVCGGTALGLQELQAGLPDGFADRLHALRIGNRLSLHLLGRQDLMALKLYAAADEHGPRQEIHFADLKGLTPTFEELDWAVDWLRTLRDFEEKRLAAKDVIERLGYEDLAYYV